MIKAYCGRNATGKTLFLQNLFKEAEEQHKRVVYNRDKSLDCKNVSPDSEIIQRINSCVDSIVVNESGRASAIKDDISNNLVNLIYVLSRNVDLIYLDEPEAGISYREQAIMLQILYTVSQFKDIVVTTHDEDICDISEVYTIDSCGKEVKAEVEDFSYI